MGVQDQKKLMRVTREAVPVFLLIEEMGQLSVERGIGTYGCKIPTKIVGSKCQSIPHHDHSFKCVPNECDGMAPLAA